MSSVEKQGRLQSKALVPKTRLRLGAFVLWAAAGAASATGAELERAPPAEPPIQLPRFVVREKLGLDYLVDERVKLRPIEDFWRYGRQGWLEVLSDCPDAEIRESVEWLHRLQATLAQQFPQFGQMRMRPTVLVLSDSTAKFEQFRPRHSGSGGGYSVRFFHLDVDQAAVVIDMDWGRNGSRDRALKIRLLRSFAHLLLSNIEPRLPAWFEEGLARSLSYSEFYDTSVVFGRFPAEQRVAHRGRDGITMVERGFPQRLGERGMPLARMFQTPYDSADNLDAAASAFAIQSYNFVQLCLYGAEGRFRNPLRELLARLGREPFTEELFVACFGLGTAEMEERVTDYSNTPVEYRIPRGVIEWVNRSAVGEEFFRHNFGEDAPDVSRVFARFGPGERSAAKAGGESAGEPPLLPHPKAAVQVLRLAQPFTPPPLALRKATPAEVGRIKGDAFRLARRYDNARAELVAGVVRGHTDARLFASFGLLERVDGFPATTEYFFNRAVQDDVDWPGAYVYLAAHRLQQALRPLGAGEKIPPAAGAEIRALLAGAHERATRPRADCYALFARLALHTAAPIDAEMEGRLQEALRLFPGDAALVELVADVRASRGETQETPGAERGAITAEARP